MLIGRTRQYVVACCSSSFTFNLLAFWENTFLNGQIAGVKSLVRMFLLAGNFPIDKEGRIICLQNYQRINLFAQSTSVTSEKSTLAYNILRIKNGIETEEILVTLNVFFYLISHYTEYSMRKHLSVNRIHIWLTEMEYTKKKTCTSFDAPTQCIYQLAFSTAIRQCLSRTLFIKWWISDDIFMINAKIIKTCCAS